MKCKIISQQLEDSADTDSNWDYSENQSDGSDMEVIYTLRGYIQ